MKFKSIAKQECIPVGCLLTTAVAATRCEHKRGLPLRGLLFEGVCTHEGFTLIWGLPSEGEVALRGELPSEGEGGLFSERGSAQPPCEQTDAYENITLPCGW